MSWLSDLTDAIGLTGGSSSDGPSIWPSVIQAGTSLAGTYFGLKQGKEQSETQLQFAQDKLAAELAAAAAKGGGKGGGGGGGGGNALALARMNNLAALYQNWGQLAAKAAESEAQTAQATGRLATDPIIARLGVLR